MAKEIADQMDSSWLMPDSAPFSSVDKAKYFEKMISFSKKFVPPLERLSVVGFLEGPRMVLARKEDSHARPPIVTGYDNEGYFTVFSGKIDHCMWVADDVGQRLKDNLNLK